MTTYTVNMSNVQAVADEMAAISQQINAMLQELEANAQSHLANWTSNARDAYNTAKIKWDAAAGDMAVQAQSAQSALSQINDAYANAEFQGLGLWGA